MKVVINVRHGGFNLSPQAIAFIHDRRKAREIPSTQIFHSDDEFGGEEDEHLWNIQRNDPDLVAAVEELGKAASGEHASLRIVEIPDDVQWEVEEYDGAEWVAEKHRTWHASE